MTGVGRRSGGGRCGRSRGGSVLEHVTEERRLAGDPPAGDGSNALQAASPKTSAGPSHQPSVMEGRSRACAPDPPLDPDVQDYCIRLPNHGFASRVDVVWPLPTKRTATPSPTLLRSSSASSAIRARFVEMGASTRVPAIFPSCGSVVPRPLPSAESLGEVPRFPRYNEALRLPTAHPGDSGCPRRR